MHHNSPTCNKVIGFIRIVLGLGMLYMGLMKFGLNADMMVTIGSAAHSMGLNFLPAMTRFWVAVVLEILAGLFLVSGCCQLTKLGARITAVIMIFALNAVGWTTPETLLAWVFLTAAVVVIIWGRGARCFCPGACCNMGKVCCADDATCQPGQQVNRTSRSTTETVVVTEVIADDGEVVYDDEVVGESTEVK